jgi:regulator of protease activity HflC (stomatin/prohibitin superfamily)
MNQANNDAVRVKTGDGSDIELDVDINYRIKADQQSIEAIVRECGLDKVVPYGAATSRRGSNEDLIDAYHERWVRDYSRSITRHVFGELTPMQFYDAGMRDSQAQKALLELNQMLDSHGLLVTQVVPGEYSYYDEYKQLIDDKKAADQEVENQIEEAKTARKNQERQVMEAEATVKARIAEMKGTLEKEYLTAEGQAAKARLGVEAEAYSKQMQGDAKLTKASNEAMALFALASAEAEGLGKLAASLSGEGGLNLVKLRYADVLKTARISGLPYSTDPRIQKVELNTGNATLGGTNR